jgi:hypothetical protein
MKAMYAIETELGVVSGRSTAETLSYFCVVRVWQKNKHAVFR